MQTPHSQRTSVFRAVKWRVRLVLKWLSDSSVCCHLSKILFRILFRLLGEEIRTAIPVSSLKGNRVLILAPHIDDEVIGCFGAMKSYLDRGRPVWIAYLTRSQKKGSKRTEEHVALERKQEAKEVAEALGIATDNLYFLEGEDGNLAGSEVSADLRKVVEKVQPDTIFLPCPLDSHRDHRAVTQHLLRALDRMDSSHVQLLIYESQSPITIFYGNVLLDISSLVGEKQKILKLFKSQKNSFSFSRHLNEIEGLLYKKSCELFLRSSVEELRAFHQKMERDRKLVENASSFPIPCGTVCGSFWSYLSSYRVKSQLTMLGQSEQDGCVCEDGYKKTDVERSS